VSEGGCQCGKVRYRLEAEPLALAVCHCTECQRQSCSIGVGAALPARFEVRLVALATDPADPRLRRPRDFLLEPLLYEMTRSGELFDVDDAHPVLGRRAGRDLPLQGSEMFPAHDCRDTFRLESTTQQLCAGTVRGLVDALHVESYD